MKTTPWKLWIAGGVMTVGLLLAGASATERYGPQGQASLPEVAVYKSPSCGCCSKWGEHLQAAGFRVTEHDVRDLLAVKNEHGVPRELGACHTALVDGYVIEGHVPAEDILRLLEERPEVRGLAVPGMPMGSPGMEGPRKDPYASLSFDAEGNTAIWAYH